MARTSRGGGARNPANQPRSVQVSRKLSWLLRHGAASEGLQLGKAGYVSVAAALNTRAMKNLKVTFEELQDLVRENDKQRFSMVLASSLEQENADAKPTDSDAVAVDQQDPNNFLIRANQGHSIAVDTEGLLTPLALSSPDLPATVVHGTNERAWKAILESGGLSRMGRTHVHFARGLPEGFLSEEEKNLLSGNGDVVAEVNESSPTAEAEVVETATATPTDAAPQGNTKSAEKVISGIRTSSTILIFIDLPAALAAGYPFSLSANGVVLCEGDKDGRVPSAFFKKVVRRRGRRVEDVMQGGELVGV